MQSTGSLCRDHSIVSNSMQQRDHSIINNCTTTRLLQPTAMLYIAPIKVQPPAMRPFVKILWLFVHCHHNCMYNSQEVDKFHAVTCAGSNRLITISVRSLWLPAARDSTSRMTFSTWATSDGWHRRSATSIRSRHRSIDKLSATHSTDVVPV